MSTVIKAENLKKLFPIKLGFFQTLVSKRELFVHAVDGVSFEIKKGEIFGLAGESGSGKTTTARLLLRLIEPTGGTIHFENKDITHLSETKMRILRRRMQIVFQDPYESLNPRFTVFRTVCEPLEIHGIGTRAEKEEKVHKALERAEELFEAPRYIYLTRHPYAVIESVVRNRLDRLVGLTSDDPGAFGHAKRCERVGRIVRRRVVRLGLIPVVERDRLPPRRGNVAEVEPA